MVKKLKTAAKIAGIFLIAFMTFSCASIQEDCCKSENPAFAESAFPVSSFVELKTYVGEDLSGTGSGSVIEREGKDAYILTAAHVCQSPRTLITGLLLQKPVVTKAFDIDGKPYTATVYAVSHKNDICIMRAKGLERPALSMSDSYPKIGKEYRNMASPLGIAEKWGLALFQGYYSGNITLRGKKFDMYAVPARGGSSGSPIFDNAGNVVGIVTMGFNRLENVSISPKYIQIRNFVHDHLAHVMD